MLHIAIKTNNHPHIPGSRPPCRPLSRHRGASEQQQQVQEQQKQQKQQEEQEQLEQLEQQDQEQQESDIESSENLDTSIDLGTSGGEHW